MLVRAFVEGELGHFLNAQAKAVDTGGRKAMRITAGAIRKKSRRQCPARLPGRWRHDPGEAGALAHHRQGRGYRGHGLSAAPPTAAALGGRAGRSIWCSSSRQGATIKSARGGYLAIPTENAPLKSARGPRGQRMTPREMIAAGQKLAFLPAGAGRSGRRR